MLIMLGRDVFFKSEQIVVCLQISEQKYNFVAFVDSKRKCLIVGRVKRIKYNLMIVIITFTAIGIQLKAILIDKTAILIVFDKLCGLQPNLKVLLKHLCRHIV